MTNEDAKVFLDNLKICIDEHPVVADWLVEIADRKTEPTISKMEQVEDEPQTEEHCETCRHKDECEGATYEYKNTEWWCLGYAPIEDEPQTDCAWK